MNSDVTAETGTQSETDATRDGEILTVMEVARFLRVPKSTVYKLARGGELPAAIRDYGACQMRLRDDRCVAGGF